MPEQPGDDPFDNYNDNTEVGVGFSDRVLLIVSVVGFGVMTLLVYGIIVSRTKSADEFENGGPGEEADYEEELLRSDVANLNRAQRRARAKALMKRQRRADNIDNQANDDSDEEHDGDDHQEEDHNNTHLSRKERNRFAKAAEKKARHLLDEERQEEQRQAMQTAKEEKKKRLKLEAEKAREEKVSREQKQESQRLEDFDKWNTFLASPDGTTTKISVDDWVQELRAGPSILPLNHLTTRFDVPLPEVKDRIQQLVLERRVTGILEEEQGLFISLSHDQLLSLASFVQKKGEVSLNDLSHATVELLEKHKNL